MTSARQALSDGQPPRHRDTEAAATELAKAAPALPRRTPALAKPSGGGKTEPLIEETLTRAIIGAAIEVHRFWGPGLYEEIYERSLLRELTLVGLPFESQVRLPLVYKGERIGEDLRLDVLVDRKVVVEVKAVAALEPIHEAQLLTYLRLTACRVALLINFNVSVLKAGIRRLVL